MVILTKYMIVIKIGVWILAHIHKEFSAQPMPRVPTENHTLDASRLRRLPDAET